MTVALTALIAGWLVLGLVPVVWWLASRARVDVWNSLPVPAALVDARGRVTRLGGPPSPDDAFASGLSALPAHGRVIRSHTSGGTPVAAAGVRGGALLVALPADPLREHRDRLLADLGARLAHDVNTPLAALVGHLDLIRHQPLTPTATASVQTCQREVARLQAITSDLLTLTRLRANPTPRTVCLAGALAEDAAGAFLDTADARGIDLKLEVPAQRVAVSVTEADVVRALRNLIANALKHGLPPGHGDQHPHPDVVVSVGTEHDAVVFAVADRGPGLDPADLPRLCDPMVRGADVRTEGSGLGLAIVAEVLAAHGSQLTCSPRPGGGTVLSFALARLP